MITEDYVSFETARLLKEKRFDERVLSFYTESGLEGYMSALKTTKNTELSSGFISRPTLQMAMKWLREVHHLAIIVDVYFPNGIVPKYAGNIWLLKSPFECYEPDNLLFATYEEAAEHTIKYCLEHFDIH